MDGGECFVKSVLLSAFGFSEQETCATEETVCAHVTD